MSRIPHGTLSRSLRPTKRSIRVTAVVLLLAGTLVLTSSATSTAAQMPLLTPGEQVPYGTHIALEETINTSNPPTEPIPPGTQVTVIATQGFFSNDENAEFVAITRNGSLVYHDNTYRVYFDVDPVPGTRYTVEYLASKHFSDCEAYDTTWCTRNIIERVNLSTGTVEQLYAETTPKVTATRWHDADRINNTHLALADIHRDSVRVINLSTGETTWEWSATAIYDSEGATRPQDWTHLNDVEVLEDGTFMLSMRNQDEVVFVKPGEGYLPNRTLGEDDTHAILYEQHNPDFLPEKRGGPAILVGDSENNRVVEYHRDDGRWEQAWAWQDAQLQWPRDADRLPNGRTLIVDSHGDRVLEVRPNRSIAWSVGVGKPYDVERLGTGDESATGTAIDTDYEGAEIEVGSLGEGLLVLKSILPSKPVNGIVFSINAFGAEWFGFTDLVVTFAMLVTLILWVGVEYRWANWSVIGLVRVHFQE